MSDRQRGLPQRSGRAFSTALDSLTDTGVASPVRAVPPVRQEPERPGTSGTQDNSGTLGVADTSVVSGTTGARGVQDTSTPPKARQHVKLRGDLADELRDAVWFLGASTRPRVQLGELLDEAVGEWLTKVKAEQNGGEDFPHKGRLR